MVVTEKTRALKIVQFFPFLLISLDKIIMYEKSGFGPSGTVNLHWFLEIGKIAGK